MSQIEVFPTWGKEQLILFGDFSQVKSGQKAGLQVPDLRFLSLNTFGEQKG